MPGRERGLDKGSVTSWVRAGDHRQTFLNSIVTSLIAGVFILVPASLAYFETTFFSYL
jgi:hypothetical protein